MIYVDEYVCVNVVVVVKLRAYVSNYDTYRY